MTSDQSKETGTNDTKAEEVRKRLSATGRNEPCPCGSGKKYKKCHLAEDEKANTAPTAPPDPEAMLTKGWQLFEQRRPGAAEKEFRAALVLRPGWADALDGIGLARLQTGDNEGARKEFSEVQRVSESIAAELRKAATKDGFQRKEAQAYIRSCHALGCMEFDEKKYAEALVELERVYAVDEGPVGTEARLIAGIALVKLDRAGEAAAILEVATKSESGTGRAPMSLALAHFLAGDTKAAETALEKALTANPSLGKVLLGRIPKRPANLSAATPGSREEAFGYAQTYGDAWDDKAKKFLDSYIATRSSVQKEASPSEDLSEAG